MQFDGTIHINGDSISLNTFIHTVYLQTISETRALETHDISKHTLPERSSKSSLPAWRKKAALISEKQKTFAKKNPIHTPKAIVNIWIAQSYAELYNLRIPARTNAYTAKQFAELAGWRLPRPAGNAATITRLFASSRDASIDTRLYHRPPRRIWVSIHELARK